MGSCLSKAGISSQCPDVLLQKRAESLVNCNWIRLALCHQHRCAGLRTPTWPRLLRDARRKKLLNLHLKHQLSRHCVTQQYSSHETETLSHGTSEITVCWRQCKHSISDISFIRRLITKLLGGLEILPILITGLMFPKDRFGNTPEIERFKEMADARRRQLQTIKNGYFRSFRLQRRYSIMLIVQEICFLQDLFDFQLLHSYAEYPSRCIVRQTDSLFVPWYKMVYSVYGVLDNRLSHSVNKIHFLAKSAGKNTDDC